MFLFFFFLKKGVGKVMSMRERENERVPISMFKSEEQKAVYELSY